MENNKELELLREYFVNDNTIGCVSKNENLKQRILVIQKQNKLKYRVGKFREFLSGGCMDEEKEFNEILKELGYEC